MPRILTPENIDSVISAPPTNSVMQSLLTLDSNVLVLGAGGKMGLHLCLMLQSALRAIESPHRVIAVSRFGSVNDREAFTASEIETIACDLSDKDAVAMLPDCPNIFFLAGAKFGTADRPDILHTMNVEVPRIVADRFRGGRIVALSTGCVYAYAPVDSQGSTEESPTDPPGAYALSCLERERAFADAAQAYGTRIAMIRLNYSVETRYGVLVDIAQKVYSGEPVDVSIPCVNVIWQGDAVAQIIRSLELAATPPLVLNITGPEKLSVCDLAQRFGEKFNRQPRFSGEPAKAVWLSDSTRARQIFGLPQTDVTTMIDIISDWLLAGYPTHNKPTGFDKTDGKF